MINSCRNGYTREEEITITDFCNSFNLGCQCWYLIDSYWDLCEGLIYKDPITRKGYFYTKERPVEIAFKFDEYLSRIAQLRRNKNVLFRKWKLQTIKEEKTKNH